MMRRNFSALLAVLLLSGCATYYAQLTPRGANAPAMIPPTVVSNHPDSSIARAATQASRISQRSGQRVEVWIDDPYGIAASCVACTDGPHIFLNSTFVSSFPYDQQVAIIAHEFAHGDLGHRTMSAQAQQLTAQAIQRLHGPGQWSLGAALLGALAQSTLTSSVTRANEAEADLYAAQRLPMAGMPSTTMADAMERDMRMQGDGRTVFWEQNHPPNAERIAYLRQRFGGASDGLSLSSSNASLSGTELDAVIARSERPLFPDLSKRQSHVSSASDHVPASQLTARDLKLQYPRVCPVDGERFLIEVTTCPTHKKFLAIDVDEHNASR